MSLGTVATGVGAFFPPVMLYLFEVYGCSGAFLIIAAIALHSSFASSLYRPMSRIVTESPESVTKDECVKDADKKRDKEKALSFATSNTVQCHDTEAETAFSTPKTETRELAES